MGIPVFILGESGTGKSTSMRNFTSEEISIIQAVKKPLPFRNDLKYRDSNGGEIAVADSAEKIIKCIDGFALKQERPVIVVDDFQYVMANEFMRRSAEKGFDKFTDIAKHAWDIVMHAQAVNANSRIYFLSHTQKNDFGEVRAKTIGKLLDEKITLEGLFTIVMNTVVQDGNYYFLTKNNGMSTVKTPMDMFSTELIENDLKAVDDEIKSYYHLEK